MTGGNIRYRDPPKNIFFRQFGVLRLIEILPKSLPLNQNKENLNKNYVFYIEKIKVIYVYKPESQNILDQGLLKP